MSQREIHIAHSPDSDDAFMFYGLASGKVESPEFEFVHVLRDIETLNQAALEGKYEVTAVSIHAYAFLHERYALLNTGASMGEGYGPMVVSATPFDPRELTRHSVAIPGEKTSAFLALQLFQPGFQYEVLPFDEILPAVVAGKIDSGLLIHEGQLFYQDYQLHEIVNLGRWWKQETGLPLPLGGNVIRRDLGKDRIARIADLIEKSIRYGLNHRPEALRYALEFGRGLDADRGDRFVQMYVNSRTLDYGEDGRRAVELFLERGYQAGCISHRVSVTFV